MARDDVEAHLHRPRLSRRQWIWTVRGIFVAFGFVVTFSLFEAVQHDQWLSVGLLSGLLVSVPCIARLVEYGSGL